MRTPKALYRTAPTLFMCELSHCPQCEGPLSPLGYVTGRKTIQTMQEVLTIAYRPKTCYEKGCRAAEFILASAAWQHLAPKYSTYGYDVIAQIGWERQIGRMTFEQIHARLRRHVQMSESMVRHLYHQKYLPLLACHERQQWPALRALAQTSGLLLSLDGLMPEGGEAQLWVVRELQTGWTLRSGWLSHQDEASFVTFLRPLAELQLPLRAILSDKQRGLLPAIARVFPTVPHAWCQIHYLQNAAAPVADADEQMKIALRQGVRASLGDLIHHKTQEKTAELTVTGLVPSPLPAPTPPQASATSQAVAQAAQEQIVHDLFQRVRYLLTLKGRPPLRLAGQEMFARLQEVVRCLDQLLRHQAEPRLLQLRQGLRQALSALRPTCRELGVAAAWLARLAAVLDPGDQPARTGAQVRAEWEACLADIEQERQATPGLQTLGTHIMKVSQSYAPGLFHTYDVPGLPRTNNARESEFRDLKRRLIITTGQSGAVKRLLLREGAWELIPSPASLVETITAISRVATHDLRQEEQRVTQHRARFRLHTRSAKQSQMQLKQLVRRWKAIPTTNTLE